MQPRDATDGTFGLDDEASSCVVAGGEGVEILHRE